MSNNAAAGVGSVDQLRQFAQNLDQVKSRLDKVYRDLDAAIDSASHTWNDKQFAAFKPKYEEKKWKVGELSDMVDNMSTYIKVMSDEYEKNNNIDMKF